MTATFTCDVAGPSRPLPHTWEHTVGSGHATLALRADYQAQLTRCHRELGVQHVRFHGILSDDMGTLIVDQGKKLYSFLNADRIADFLIGIGMRPFVELSFMPSCLGAGTQTVMHYHDIVSPPKDYREWATLIRTLVRHWIDRYGVEEVRTWPFEVWNEPNLPSFWPSDQEAYFRLYQTTVRAIKEIDADIRVGGPATAENAWIPQFRAFCQANDLPVDFISTHLYPTDALGNAEQDTVGQLAASPRDYMRAKATEARAQAGDLPLLYTEWSSSSNPHDPLHDEPYAAAFAARTVMETADLVTAYSWWTFSDIFDENYFPSEPYYGGFGLLNLYGVPKPTYRAYELLHGLGDRLLTVAGTHSTVDAYVTLGSDEKLSVLLTNHALPRHPIRTESVTVRLTRCPHPRGEALIQRVDADHTNPCRTWRDMGRPAYPSAAQVALLEAASVSAPQSLRVEHDGDVTLMTIELPPHGVASISVPLGSTPVRP